jgi:S1/P1 Nuclease
MKQLVVGALACVMVALVPSVAAAWNSVGHLAVAKLAYDQLPDAQKTRLFTLLKSHPHFEMFLAVDRPADVSEVEWVILRSSIWPDWARPRKKEQRGPQVTRYHRGEDHYVNVPLIDPKDADFFAGKTLVSPDLTNVLCALKQRANELRTKTALAEDKAVAICWLFHLIGDIHQPLHNVAYFSSDPAFQKGDQGGNKFGVRVNGRPWKLHAYWDEVLGEDKDYEDDSAKRQLKIYQDALAVADNLRGRELSDADKERLAKNLTFASWSEESFALAKSVGYQKPDGGGMLEGVEVKFNGSVPADAPETGAKYAEIARATAEVRVILAGQRLAKRMKMLLPK